MRLANLLFAVALVGHAQATSTITDPPPVAPQSEPLPPPVHDAIAWNGTEMRRIRIEDGACYEVGGLYIFVVEPDYAVSSENCADAVKHYLENTGPELPRA